MEALRTVISVSRISFTLGFTRVSIKFLLCKDAEPFNPQNGVGLPSRAYWMFGAEMMVRSAWPPWWALYIPKTWPTGVTQNLSS